MLSTLSQQPQHSILDFEEIYVHVGSIPYVKMVLQGVFANSNNYSVCSRVRSKLVTCTVVIVRTVRDFNATENRVWVYEMRIRTKKKARKLCFIEFIVVGTRVFFRSKYSMYNNNEKEKKRQRR